MTRVRFAPALLFVLLLQACTVSPGRESSVGREAGRAEEREESAEPGDTALARQLFGSDLTPPEAHLRALAQTRRLEASTKAADPRLLRLRWKLVGPTNIGGRILDLALDPENNKTIYAAAASGGVWKSTNGARTFKPAWPHDQSQAVGALTIDSDGILYAGTGETGPGGGSLTYGGLGLYRSKNGGKTWQNIGLQGSSRISRIVIDPEDDRRIFVAASGPLFAPGGERGLYRSENRGRTWDRVIRGDNPTTGAVDVAIDPSNPDRMYAAMWDHLREPDRRRYNGIGSGLYRSDDGGDTWTRIGPGLFGPHPAIGRIGIAISPSDPQILYATVSGEAGAYAGFYKSLDGGDTWIPIAHPLLVENNFVYGWWFGRVWVDPEDSDHVFQAGVDLAVSRDGGINWEFAPAVHADQHAMVWDPEVKDRIYLGNDGGVYRTDDDGRSWQFGLYQPWSQLYSIDVGEQSPERQVAGLQDHGIARSYDAGGQSSPGGWAIVLGGDGVRTNINPEDQNIVYGCTQYGACSVSHNGGGNFDSFGDLVISARKNWFTPIEFDPVNPSTLYSGGEILSRSDDDAASWTPISPDLSNGPGRETNPLYRNFGTITTIAPGPSDTGVIYLGTDDGNLWVTADGGTTWTKSTDADLPIAWVTRVEIDPEDTDVAYVTYSGFRQGIDTAYVLRTTDGGVNWTNITGDLPLAPVNDVNVVGDALVVASDFGVFISRDLGRHWLTLGRDLPLVPVHELRWHRPSRTLYAATFGRSAWKVELPKDI